MLSGIGAVTGLDIDPEVEKQSLALERVRLFRRTNAVCRPIVGCLQFELRTGTRGESGGALQGSRAVLRPGGVYCFRTPNLFHYVSMGARLMPHSMHLLLANRLRALDKDAHDPYPTWFRSNTPGKLRKLCRVAELEPPSISMIEPEPSYGRAHTLLFYPMMVYERTVNLSNALARFRITMLVATCKPRH